MKIGIFGVDNFSDGKENIIDQRLDKIEEMAHSAKKVYIQVELVTDIERLKESNGIVCLKGQETDLIIADLEFIEKRIANAQEDKERDLLNRMRGQLEKEHFIFELDLPDEEKQIVSGYPLLSFKPVFLIEPGDLEDKPRALVSAYAYFGYIAFFTANEKDARAWSIKKGTSCWEASGLIHSAIQKGFIRAEVTGFNDLVNDGGISQARVNNHLRIEDKDYIVRDGDLIKFRFNK